MPDPAVRALLEGNMKRLTPMTLALDGLLEQLQTIRRCGFATDGGEHMVGVGSVSTGLQTDQGHYALTVVGPVARIQAAGDSIHQALLECREGIQHSVDSA
jgi:DNA-binding IclR family transcriptional regulator